MVAFYGQVTGRYTTLWGTPVDPGHVLNALGISDAEKLVDIAHEIYGQESTLLTQNRRNYEIVAEDAVAAARRFGSRKSKELSSQP